jgi:hypothetical protein
MKRPCLVIHISLVFYDTCFTHLFAPIIDVSRFIHRRRLYDRSVDFNNTLIQMFPIDGNP